MKLQVMKLNDDKYWIELVDHHGNYTQNEWTKRHSPIEVIEFIELGSDALLEVKLKEYMLIYGWQNVRGGDYSDYQIWKPEFLMKEEEHWDYKPPVRNKKKRITKSEIKTDTESKVTKPKGKYLYILKLDNDRFFCSSSCSLDYMQARLDEMRYPEFVTKSKSIELVKTIYTEENFLKRNVLRELTLKLMAKKGWQNVRGSCWQDEVITRPEELDTHQRL